MPDSESAERPSTLHSSKSFTRLEPSSPKSATRSRASTIQGIPEILFPQNVTQSPDEEEKAGKGDVFVSQDEDHSADATVEGGDAEGSKVPETFEDLPIEIRSLTERFLESLSAKVHPQPLSADALAELFQEFYTRAFSQISTHIATLSSRIGRDSHAQKARTISTTSRKGTSPPDSEQQMLTVSEIASRKRARRQLELKRVALEEAVERVVCERVYDRIWRHRSTDDAERDEKLRSRTAALSLVGIGLRGLLVSKDEITEDLKEKTVQQESDVKEWLTGARDSLHAMDAEHYPLGKLHHLTAAHKSIVETLSRLFPSSSSADEILPTLIYALITSPPDSINIISNLSFIQRFRSASRVDGETAYCLVNLEAAISFLETVDLSSLRANEVPEGPDKTNSRPSTPRSDPTPMNLGIAAATTPARPAASSTSSSSSVLKPEPSPTNKSQRRLSNLIQAQTNRLEAASDAVRESILDSADQALDSFNNTLENSFKFLFGRMKEQQAAATAKNVAAGGEAKEPVSLPKTLEDARKLVSSPPRTAKEELGSGQVSAASSVLDHPLAETDEHEGMSERERRMAELFGGRRATRDRSTDSMRSSGSLGSKKVAFQESTASKAAASQVSVASTPGAIDQMRNLGNSFNPLSRLGSMNLVPKFGRTGTFPQTAEKSYTGAAAIADSKKVEQSQEPPKPATREIKALAAIEDLRKTSPPIKRFLDCKDVKELKLGEVDALLKDYQRLAGAMRGAITSTNS